MISRALTVLFSTSLEKMFSMNIADCPINTKSSRITAQSPRLYFVSTGLDLIRLCLNLHKHRHDENKKRKAALLTLNINNTSINLPESSINAQWHLKSSKALLLQLKVALFKEFI